MLPTGTMLTCYGLSLRKDILLPKDGFVEAEQWNVRSGRNGRDGTHTDE